MAEQQQSELGIGGPGPWQPGKCRVPMWMMGNPAGLCGEPAYGHQLPAEILKHDRNYGGNNRIPYCFGHCCPMHGGPSQTEPRVFQDGYTEFGRPMWCAVNPDFENLKESPAGFDGDPLIARANLANEAALASAQAAK